MGIYVAALAAGDTLTYQVVQFGRFTISGSAFIFPLIYTINDIITEIYGFKIAKQTIIAGLVAEGFFDIACGLIAHLPTNQELFHSNLYKTILGALPRVYVSALLAIALSLFVNSFIMNKTKIATQGRFFAFRSILSTLVGEIVFLLVFYLMTFSGKTSFSNIFELIGTSLITKIFFLLIIIIPATLVVKVIRHDHKNKP